MTTISAARQRKLDGLEGLIHHDTAMILAGLAGDVQPPAVIVEVGSFKGRSACYLAEGAKVGGGAEVYCVDPWDLPGNIHGKHGFTDPAVRATFDRQTRAMGHANRIHALQAFSTVAAESWPRNIPIGLLFLDGSHEYADVRADFEAWSPYVPAGGVVVFDDYESRNKGVTRFVDELRNIYRWEFSPFPNGVFSRLAIARLG